MGWVVFVMLISVADPDDWTVAVEKNHVFATESACHEFVRTSPGIAMQRADWNSPTVTADWGCITHEELRALGYGGAGEIL